MTSARTGSDIEWDARLSRIAGAAKEWQARMSGAPAPIESGSPLAGDDAQFTALSVSQIASYSIAVAVEHLDFCMSMMVATGTTYPSAYLTVLRTALLTASHAAWVLHPTQRAQRQANALRVEAYDMRSQLSMLSDAFTVSPAGIVAKKKAIDALQTRQRGLQAVADALSITEDVTKMQLNNTLTIEQVAKYAHGDDLAAGGVNTIWRSASSAAHGGRQFAVMRITEDAIHGVPGARFARLTGNIPLDIGPAAAAAALALSKAFELLDLRRVNHRKSSTAVQI
jgi:hypothetical protein